MKDRLTVRADVPADIKPLTNMLNNIIRVGGTTAIEEPLSQAEFSDYFLHGSNFIMCNVAEDIITRQPVGFQVLLQYPHLSDVWVDIATFAQMSPKIKGVGSALFAETHTKASELGIRNINATIRSDNYGGLAYYAKMGFETYKTIHAIPLKNGTPVDRILKRYDLA